LRAVSTLDVPGRRSIEKNLDAARRSARATVSHAKLFLRSSLWSQQRPETDAGRVRKLIADYVALAGGDDSKFAEVWDHSPDVSFIHPLGEAHG
jgi:hypothetical protein